MVSFTQRAICFRGVIPAIINGLHHSNFQPRIMGKFATQSKTRTLNIRLSPVNHALICSLATANQTTITDYLISLVRADYLRTGGVHE